VIRREKAVERCEARRRISLDWAVWRKATAFAADAASLANSRYGIRIRFRSFGQSHGTAELGKSDSRRKYFRHRMQRVSKKYVPRKSDIAGECGIRTHVESRCRSVRWSRRDWWTIKSCQSESSVSPTASWAPWRWSSGQEASSRHNVDIATALQS